MANLIDPSEWALEDAKEPYVMPDGSECKLRIIEVHRDKDKNGNFYYLPRLEVQDEPYSKDFTCFLSEPSRTLDAKKLNQARYEMLSFCEAFEIDLSRMTDPTEDWTGHTGWAILTVEDHPKYGKQNKIAKLIRPK